MMVAARRVMLLVSVMEVEYMKILEDLFLNFSPLSLLPNADFNAFESDGLRRSVCLPEK